MLHALTVTTFLADDLDSEFVSCRVGLARFPSEHLVNGVMCCFGRVVDVFIARDGCDPSFLDLFDGVSSVCVCLIFSAVLPCYSHTYLPFVFKVGMHDDGDLNTTHTSYIPVAKKKPVIICGDLNVAANPIDLKNPKANQGSAGYTQEEREKFRQLLDAGFVDTFRMLHPDEVKYSWWSYMFKARERNAGWRIDYFLASEDAKDKIVEADILTDIQGSDHCPVLLHLDV